MITRLPRWRGHILTGAWNETFWNGTAGEVVDFGSASNPGTAASLGTTAKPTTDNVSPVPAITGSPGTCRYGRFNRTNKNYVALPAGYPALAAAGQTGFSITAWINSTNTALPGQRIMIDDQNDTAPGAWGFSVGETDRAGAGGVRFYYRQGTTFTLDTVAVPSNQWLFVALSVSLATGTGASRGNHLCLQHGGTPATSYTDVFTWTPGSDAGPPSSEGKPMPPWKEPISLDFRRAGRIARVPGAAQPGHGQQGLAAREPLRPYQSLWNKRKHDRGDLRRHDRAVHGA